MHYVGRRASETNPLRSMPFIRPAPVAHTPEFLAAWELDRAAGDMPIVEKQYAYARQCLDEANRRSRVARRRFQAQAMRFLNKAHAQLRAARVRVAKAQAAVEALRLQPVLPVAA